MISVTVAAQGKPKRLFGGNFRGYGSGRLSISDLEKDVNYPKRNSSSLALNWKIVAVFTKIVNFVISVLKLWLPFYDKKRFHKRPQNKDDILISYLPTFDDKILLNIFDKLSRDDILSAKLVCRKWSKVISQNIRTLVIIRTDQIRILFDEGEVMIYPIDEKKCPVRYPLPPLQILQNRLSHFTTQSLFVRGLIPVESGPVLRLLLNLSLRPQQMYFIWSKFSADSIYLLENLLESNSSTVTDFGLEECSPSLLLTDRLLQPILNHITSIRLWNNGKCSHYGVTDLTLFGISNSILNGFPVETIDLGTCIISSEAVVSIIKNWNETATSDLCIMLTNCCPVKNHQLKKKIRESGGSLETSYPFLQVYNFTQKLDHFDPLNEKTWNQKYFYNPLYSRNNSIVFLMIGGEGPENGHWAAFPDVQYLQWAKEFGADVFDLEHRFFGDSWPIPNMDTSSLELLTTQQALADIAFFIQSMNKIHNFKNPRWVTFGGSYPGALSAWFRQKYPELTVGAVASSAPVNLKLDFYEYAMVVEDDLTLTDQACSAAVKTAFNKIQNLSLTGEGRDSLNVYFNLVPKFDTKTTKLDINNFFGNLFNIFQGMTQYTYDGQSENTHSNLTLRRMCDIMTNSTEPDVVKRVRNLFMWYNFFNPAGTDLSVMPNSYSDVIKQIGSGNLTVLGQDGAAARGWMWLCCNEIGFMQTTNQGSNVFGSGVPLNLFIDMCSDLFGSNINMAYIRDKNKKSNSFYGGADFYNATNVVLPNGSLDPWHALGTYSSNLNLSLLPYLINGTAHCADMYPSYEGEPKVLPAARSHIKNSVKEFINYDPLTDGPKSLGFCRNILLNCSLYLLAYTLL